MEVEGDSLFLSEFSGDSDANLTGISASLDGDDAESCSWDTSDQCPSNWTNEEDEHDLIVDDLDCSNEHDCEDCCEEDCVHGDDIDDDADDENRGFDWNAGEIGRPRSVRRKSSASEDSTTKESEPLDEMEKNRLFWEACLAS